MHWQDPALQRTILKAKIVELPILLIGSVRSDEYWFATAVSDVTGKLAGVTVDVPPPDAIDSDCTIVHDKNPFATAR
jgi:hypothetical protein